MTTLFSTLRFVDCHSVGSQYRSRLSVGRPLVTSLGHPSRQPCLLGGLSSTRVSSVSVEVSVTGSTPLPFGEVREDSGKSEDGRGGRPDVPVRNVVVHHVLFPFLSDTRPSGPPPCLDLFSVLCPVRVCPCRHRFSLRRTQTRCTLPGRMPLRSRPSSGSGRIPTKFPVPRPGPGPDRVRFRLCDPRGSGIVRRDRGPQSEVHTYRTLRGESEGDVLH